MTTPSARILIIVAVLLGIVVRTPPNRAADGQSTAIAAPAGYSLVWSDEFDRDGAPDPANWTYEEGFVRNNEAQWYTGDRRENARVENGMLVIEGRKERFANPAHDPGKPVQWRNAAFAEYTSASLTTQGRRSMLYGRIEVRARLPQGRGVWPAIWTLGDNRSQVGWPACGEIDIMEFVGHTPDKTHATLHWQRDGKHVSSGQALTVERPWDAFHVWAVDWTETAMTFWFDDRQVQTFDVSRGNQPDGSNSFRKPHYLLINLALGGSWGREIDDSIFPQRYVIDYVRVYRPAP
jgi:beta-glucanase (GH16 family)